MLRAAWPHDRLMRVHGMSESADSTDHGVRLWGLDASAHHRAFGKQLAEIWRNACVTESDVQLDEYCAGCGASMRCIPFMIRACLQGRVSEPPQGVPQERTKAKSLHAGCHCIASEANA